MFSLNSLHKWVLSCVLVFSLTGVTNAYTYQANISVFTTELIVQNSQKKASTYFISFEFTEFDQEDVFDFNLFLKRNNSLFNCKIIHQNNELSNSFYNYQRCYLKLLSLQYAIDLV